MRVACGNNAPRERIVGWFGAGEATWSAIKAGCPILARSLRKGGIPRTPTPLGVLISSEGLQILLSGALKMLPQLRKPPHDQQLLPGGSRVHFLMFKNPGIAVRYKHRMQSRSQCRVD